MTTAMWRMVFRDCPVLETLEAEGICTVDSAVEITIQTLERLNTVRIRNCDVHTLDHLFQYLRAPFLREIDFDFLEWEDVAIFGSEWNFGSLPAHKNAETVLGLCMFVRTSFIRA